MKKLFILSILVFLSACTTENVIDYSKKQDTEIFELAMKQINDGNNISAANSFMQIEYNYPYSPLVAKSWYLMGYAYYLEGKYADAIEQFERLLKFQPNHPQAPYAAYMIAISYYDQISPITRDQKMTEMALIKMSDVVQKYPDTKFAEDLKPKIIIAKNDLAAKEMYIAKTLMTKQNIIGALNRYQTVIRKFETTLFVPEALFRTVEIYNIMGEKEEAMNMTRLLEVNYPESEWYKLAKEACSSD